MFYKPTTYPFFRGLLPPLTPILFILTGLLTTCAETLENPPKAFEPLPIQGADMSYLPQLRASGLALHNENHQAEDPLQILKRAGVNTIRFRLWKRQEGTESSLSSVQALCAEVRALGMKTLVSVHYSDTWADPGHQSTPPEWKSLPTEALIDSIYAYTRQVVSEIQPDYIQIGNEINQGLLWPAGHNQHPATMKTLLQSGIRAVREYSPKSKVILHYAGLDGAIDFFGSLSDLDVDILGISYYPIWHGKSLQLLKATCNGLYLTQHKPVLLAETAYPFTLSWDDWTTNIIGDTSQILPGFTASPQGQHDFLAQIRDILADVPQSAGFCYWGGEWISFRGKKATDGSSWENQAFWDFAQHRLPVLDVYSGY